MTTRGLAATLANLGLMVGLATALAVAGAAPESPAAVTRPAQRKPVNVPDWDPAAADRYPDCSASLPTGVIPSSLVVVNLAGEVQRMDFDKAWAAAHDDNAANNLWVIGACA